MNFKMQLVYKLCTLILVTWIIIAAVTESQMISGYDAYMSTGYQERKAFYALRSCHQSFFEDRGEFFSPDYLCSNPALWCNWTIQVPRGQRVQLYLEDLTPDHTCHLKTDQIHIDESPLSAGERRILERCWKSAMYMSISNVVRVVQLIGPNPNPPHRGFYATYQAFRIPGAASSVFGDPHEDAKEKTNKKALTPSDVMNLFTNEVHMREDSRKDVRTEPEHIQRAIDSWSELPADHTTPWEKNFGEIRKTRDESENPESALYNNGIQNYSTRSSTVHTPVLTQPPTSTKSTKYFRRLTTQVPLNDAETTVLQPSLEDINVAAISMETTDGGKNLEPDVDEHAGDFRDNKQSSTRRSKQSNKVKEKSLPAQNLRHAEPPHLPGGLLLEVALELSMNQNHGDIWAQEGTSIKAAVENMIHKSLEDFSLKSVTSKRFKKLHAGALLIMWVQFGKNNKKNQTPKIQSLLEHLEGQDINPSESRSGNTILSVSVEDINECETQLVMCDLHAECVNEFGSYSCHCRHGYSSGLGGAVCLVPENNDCKQTSTPMLLYIVAFLLCFLITLLLVTLGVLYRRSHRGTFLPQCHYNSNSTSFTPHDVNNNPNSGGTDSSSRLPPPPPPMHLTRGMSDLPLLRFSPLSPPEKCEDKLQEKL